MKTTDKFLSAVALAAAALCASCSTDDLASQRQQGQAETTAMSLTATVNDASTRAGMSKDDAGGSIAKFYWHNKDAILVQTKNADGTYSGTMFHTNDETGATTATFWGDALSGSTLGQYALYPYNEKHVFTSAGITYNLPASYTYTTVDNGIFSKTDATVAPTTTTYRTNSTNIPMLGTVADGKVKFNYLGGLAVIRIDKMPCASGTLTVSADQQLSGNFWVENLSSDAEITTRRDPEKDADKQVTFAFSGATRDEVGVFYLPMATGDYSNVKIVLNCENFNQTVECGDLTVTAGNATAIPVVANRIINGHVFVDLGLSVLWAETNVGAETAADDGYYFAWGETEATTKETYDWTTYKYYNLSTQAMTKYNTNDASLESTDDAATANWLSPCRMPTNAEFYELLNSEYTNCNYWKNISMTTSSGSDITGFKITSTKTGNSIFLPNSGHRNGGSLEYRGLKGFYWPSTKTLDESNVNCLFFGTDGSFGQGPFQCYGGLSVRPVADKE